LYLTDPEHLTLRLFIPVAQVAKIDIGDKFEISADAYPNEVFSGSVLRIADEAQFTPATVLTQEERVKLVFAVELLLEDPSGKLKSGMPVDAVLLS
jgi:HlyD family secretion protein